MKKILLIEDEQDLLKTIRMILEMAGYQVITAEDGIDGLNKARSLKPDLIILDLMLPRLDGYSLSHILKFDVKYKSMPIVILTARAQEKDEKMAKEAGADVFIVKPFELDLLLETIKNLIGS